MTKPEISVIVPIYNVETYLPQCLGGIRGQLFRNFELILVDDGSKDSSGALCDAFAEHDSRICVIHQANGGVSKARNRGLDEAKGDFIVFVDADDLVRPNYLFDLMQAQRDLSDELVRTMILSDYQPFSKAGQEKRIFPTPFVMDFRTGEGLDAKNFRELIFQFRLFPPYCKLYRRDVIEEHQIRFREGMRSAEDFDFNIRYLAAVDRLVYIDSVQYDYRVGYKQYVPSNHGVLGESEIKSAHIMAHGITDLATRMGILDEVQPEIDRWAANKHYFNRLEMLFAPSEQVSKSERKALYRQLLSDPVYRNTAKRGAATLPKSTRRLLACRADFFEAWFLYYSLQRKRSK